MTLSTDTVSDNKIASDSFSIVVLISGRGSNLKAIFEYIAAQHLNITITAVISNKADALGLDIARQFKAESIFVDPKEFQDRETFDMALKNIIDHLAPDLIVLAGFMRILSDNFVSHFLGKLINIHPSLLPKFKGLNTHQRALNQQELEHGCSVHFVTPELDGGPVIAQSSFIIESKDTISQLEEKTHQLEHQLYPLVIHWISQKRITLVNERLTISPVILKHEMPSLEG